MKEGLYNQLNVEYFLTLAWCVQWLKMGDKVVLVCFVYNIPVVCDHVTHQLTGRGCGFIMES